MDLKKLKKRREQADAWTSYGLTDVDYQVSRQVDADCRTHGLPVRKPGLASGDKYAREGYIDFRKYPVKLWTRRQIYNRVCWLTSELSRLKRTNGDTAKIAKRTAQLKKYTQALVDLKPFHDQIRAAKKVVARRKTRAKAKATKLARQIAHALRLSRKSLE